MNMTPVDGHPPFLGGNRGIQDGRQIIRSKASRLSDLSQLKGLYEIVML